jgi:rubrerythrin
MAQLNAIDEFRIMCPECETEWSTMGVPSECPTCGALVTFRIVRKPPIPNAPK